MEVKSREMGDLPQVFTPDQMMAQPQKPKENVWLFVGVAVGVLAIGFGALYLASRSEDDSSDERNKVVEKVSKKTKEKSQQKQSRQTGKPKVKSDQAPGVDAKGATAIFDKDGRVLYKNRYYSVKDARKVPALYAMLAEYGGDDPKYKGRMNTSENWRALGMEEYKSKFYTRPELVKGGLGYVFETKSWTKIDVLKYRGYVKSEEDGYWYSSKEMEKKGYFKRDGKWTTVEMLKKLGMVQTTDGTWKAMADLVALNYYHNKDDNRWYSPDEMKKMDYVFYEKNWRKRDDLLADETVAVCEGRVISVEQAKKEGLKQMDDGTWGTEEQWYTAKGFKKLGDKWITAKQYDAIMERKEKNEDSKQKMEQDRNLSTAARKLYGDAIKNFKKKPDIYIGNLKKIQSQYAETSFYRAMKYNIDRRVKRYEAIAKKAAEVKKMVDAASQGSGGGGGGAKPAGGGAKPAGGGGGGASGGSK